MGAVVKAGVERLVVLPRRVVHQPTPELNAGGDCGACVLAGLTGLAVPEVYERLREKPGVRSFGHHCISDALRIAHYDLKLVDRYVDTMPTWSPSTEALRAWGDPSWMRSGEWFNYLTMALEAGYYAISCVRHDKSGPMTGGTDHWVMLCGTRVRWEPFEFVVDGKTCHSSSGSYEVLVSCSSRTTPDEEWVEAGEFLKQRGGFFLFLARPA